MVEKPTTLIFVCILIFTECIVDLILINVVLALSMFIVIALSGVLSFLSIDPRLLSVVFSSSL